MPLPEIARHPPIRTNLALQPERRCFGESPDLRHLELGPVYQSVYGSVQEGCYPPSPQCTSARAFFFVEWTQPVQHKSSIASRGEHENLHGRMEKRGPDDQFKSAEATVEFGEADSMRASAQLIYHAHFQKNLPLQRLPKPPTKTIYRKFKPLVTV